MVQSGAQPPGEKAMKQPGFIAALCKSDMHLFVQFSITVRE